MITSEEERLKDNIVGLAHIGIPVSNMEKTKAFYEEVLGMEVTYETNLGSDFEDTNVCFMKLGDMVIEFYENASFVRKPAGSIDHIAFKCNDFDAAVEHLKNLRCADDGTPLVHCKTMFDGGAKWIFIEGPDGERIEITQKL